MLCLHRPFGFSFLNFLDLQVQRQKLTAFDEEMEENANAFNSSSQVGFDD